jgi:carbamoyltransferase
MKILAINPGHNGSAALLVDGQLKYYVEEERLSRQKYDGNPFRGILESLKYGPVDVLVLGGTHEEFPRLPWTGEDPYTALLRKFNSNLQTVNMGASHHLGHAAGAFYNSGFEDAAAVIVDGAGSRKDIQLDDNMSNPGYETETIFDCSYEDIKPVYAIFGGNSDTQKAVSETLDMDSSVTIVKAYEAVSYYLGFGWIEAGKTMGLAPYGRKDDSLPNLFFNGRGDRNVLLPNYPAGAFVDSYRIPELRQTEDPKAWHTDPSKVTDAAKNLAWSVQDETQRLVGDLIEKAVDMTGKKNIVIAGGYGLNCVANYYYKKRFPDLNIYVDPISHDGGTAIGLAKLIYHSHTKDKKITPLKSLYLGPEHDTKYDLGDFETRDVKPADVAKLISEKNIVAMYQGRSEAGPRALGNRSILYDPTDPDGKDTVNKVKGREWFRPFAGSMMQEHFEEWFDTYGMKESPFMMYAMDFKTDKHGECPAITHVDGTCRIQTVTKEQNEVYHTLIDEFRKITGVPILFNTSFNLAGEPLVETLQDAIKTIMNSDINYLYLPEIGKLVVYEANNMNHEFEEERAA